MEMADIKAIGASQEMIKAQKDVNWDGMIAS
jgi:hypothetical protein